MTKHLELKQYLDKLSTDEVLAVADWVIENTNRNAKASPSPGINHHRHSLHIQEVNTK